MGRKTLGEFAELITKRLKTLDDEDAAAEGNRDTVMLDQQSVGRLSRMDALQQQAMAEATHRRRAQERQQLEAARKRIADGSFGECRECGETIDPARLRLNPALTVCITCARGG